MGLIRTLLERRELTVDPRLLRMNQTSSGVPVTTASSMTVPALWACIRVLAESVAQLPLVLHERMDNNGRQRAEAHPLYRLLHDLPNPDMTSFQLRETLMVHLLTWGNAYCEIVWTRSGQVESIWPIPPDRITVERLPNGGPIIYDVWTDPENGRPPDRLPAYRVWHIAGMGFNGLVGFNPLRTHMENIGLALATREYGARFFGNGARPGVILKHPGTLSDEAYERLKASFNDAHEGLSNAHRTKILEEGMDFATVGVPPEEAQFLGTRQFQTEEIARIYRVPPHMIGDLSKATFSNIEHQGMEFAVHTLGPWLVRWEQTILRDLMAGSERQRFFPEFIVAGLMRGDTQSRYEAYQKAVQGGWMSPNDVRMLENLPPIPNGDIYLMPLNMAPLGSQTMREQRSALLAPGASACGHRHVDARVWGCTASAPQRGERRAQTDDEVGQVRTNRQTLARSYLLLFEDVAGRTTRREVKAIRRAVNSYLRERGQVDFEAWLQEFYRDFSPVIIQNFAPVIESLAMQALASAAQEINADDPGMDDTMREFIQGYLDAFAVGYTRSSIAQLIGLLNQANADGEDLADVVDERLTHWEESRPADTARFQAFEAMNALVIAGYARHHVERLRWSASGTSCAFCLRIDGTIISIADYFVTAGATLTDGAGQVMSVNRNKRHGPLHDGCDCVVIAA